MKDRQPTSIGGNVAADRNDDRWNDKYPDLGTDPIPNETYLSREYFSLERERIFRKVWLNVYAGRTSVVVVRGQDDQLHAFHNMCSHRGNEIVWDQRGSCQNLTCKFHGRSYGLDGTLRFVPDEGRFCDLKRDNLGPIPVAVDTWAGFIFIHLDPHPTETLRAYLARFDCMQSHCGDAPIVW